MNEADGAGRKRKWDSTEGSSSGVASKALNKGDDSARIKQEPEDFGEGSALGYASKALNEADDSARIKQELEDVGEGSTLGIVEPLELHIGTTFDISNGIGFGGFIIDKKGKWMKGYMGNYGSDAKVLELEMQAAYHGLVLLSEMGYKGTKVYLPGNMAKEILKHYEDDFKDDIEMKELYLKCSKQWNSTESYLCTEKPSSTAYSNAALWLAEEGGRQDKEYVDFFLPPIREEF